MQLKEFFEQVRGIVLSPSSVEDLNESFSGMRKYVMMDIDGSLRYITGIIIPTQQELDDMMDARRCGLGGLASSQLAGEMGLNDHNIEELKRAYENYSILIRSIYERPEIIALDLRWKAKKMGADGVVDIRLYDREDFYMGTPVRLRKIPLMEI